MKKRNTNTITITSSNNIGGFFGKVKIGFLGSAMKTMGSLVICLMVFSVIFSVAVVLRDPPSDHALDSFANRFLRLQSNQAIESDDKLSESLEPKPNPIDKLLNGLLSEGFDESSCLSRYESSSYRKDAHKNKPSSYLLSKLRSYEALHKRCGPYTELYNRTVERLRSEKGQRSGESECDYLVWVSFSGLGNRILTLASAFLYSLLTNRVLLVDQGVDMSDLFCEPFPGVSWFLPPDFPLKSRFPGLGQKTPERYGKMVKENVSISKPLSGFLYLHLVHDYDFDDKLFFCDQDQGFIKKIPWLIVKTDNYFVPSLFLIPSFERELNDLFPEKDMVFHFLGRYLLHPTNEVWGLITRYHRAYLSDADERIGIQIRVFDVGPGPFQHVLDQILACTTKENNILPKLTNSSKRNATKSKKKAVLVTSLSSGYSEKIRDMYWENTTESGDSIGVFQPSHEEFQQTDKKRTHNRKALAEMYLLSLTDVLVTSSWSTFGYVAQSLGGLKPWILTKPPENRTVPDPPCVRAVSPEPCFHAPPLYDCKAKRGADTGKMVPHVRHCEDMSWGLKLVHHHIQNHTQL